MSEALPCGWLWDAEDGPCWRRAARIFGCPHDRPLPSPGEVIDAWPPGVPLRERAPVRGWTVLDVTDTSIVLDEAAIPRASAWRLSER